MQICVDDSFIEQIYGNIPNISAIIFKINQLNANSCKSTLPLLSNRPQIVIQNDTQQILYLDEQ